MSFLGTIRLQSFLGLAFVELSSQGTDGHVGVVIEIIINSDGRKQRACFVGAGHLGFRRHWS